MKCLLALTFFFITATCFGQTQSELNIAEKKKYLDADAKLNFTYQKILKEYKADTAFIKNLKASQKLWVQFRDAEMNVKFPRREPGYYGSVLPMCWSAYLTQLTEERTRTLQVWLDGIEEGDVCSGSVKIKE